VIVRRLRGYGDASPGGIFELPGTIAMVGGGVLAFGVLMFILLGRST
jgi:hypothetical protein